MLIDFNTYKEMTFPGMNQGTGTMTAKMFMNEKGKIIHTAIHPGGSIGSHKHTTSDDINYVLAGNGKAYCDDEEELLNPGCCHICPKGSTHAIFNTGNTDLILLTVVVER